MASGQVGEESDGNSDIRKFKRPTQFILSDQDKRSMYDAGFLDLLQEDEGMGDFLHDMMNRMDKNVGAS
ncbi:hypothetical protein P3S67_002279 [Capsicum chacoense]